jgi:hypothetical protein
MSLEQFKYTRARGEGEGCRIAQGERGRGVGSSSGRSAVSGARYCTRGGTLGR